MKLLKMILVALFLTSVAFAEGANDHVRQLEPNGVFVDPKQQERQIEKIEERELVFTEVALVDHGTGGFPQPVQFVENKDTPFFTAFEMFFLFSVILLKALFWRWVIRG